MANEHADNTKTPAPAAKTSDVTTPCAGYQTMSQEWRMIDALLGGTKAMRREREEYLPRFEGEDDKNYEKRLKNTYLYNHYKKAVQALVGKPFSSSIARPENEPEELKPIANDFDMLGNDVTMYAKKWFECGLSYGLSYTFVDMPNMEGYGYTRAQEKALNLRPYAVHYSAKNIIGWRAISVNGVQKLQQLRIRTSVANPDGEFGDAEKDIVRVYDWDPATLIVTWRVFEEVDALGWVMTKTGTLVGMDEIPLVCFYTGQVGFMVAEPPLLDLAYLNVAHWQTTSDYRHIMHMQAAPILFAKGWGSTPPSVTQIGPNRMLVAANTEADLRFVEHSGQAIGKLESYINKLEDQMTAMAIKLMAERRPGGVTASEVIIDADAAESALKSMVTAINDAIEYVIYYMELWKGRRLADEQIPKYKVSDDFNLMMGNDLIATWLLKANAQGIITKKTVGEQAKAVGYLPSELDMDDELEEAAEETQAAFEAMNAALGDSTASGDTPPGQGDPSGTGDPAAGAGDGGASA